MSSLPTPSADTLENSTRSPSWKIKLLYDGECPLCLREVNFLQKRDAGRGLVAFVDIAAENFDILTAVKRTAIPHHATFLEWSLNGVDASRDAATLAVVLRFPTRPFKVSECPPATLIFTAAFTSRS
jgi:predicted DCC family thiol-disulfide oxidoreductase YuxK